MCREGCEGDFWGWGSDQIDAGQVAVSKYQSAVYDLEMTISGSGI